ncbi:acyltransferase ChoActase/COT/CPT [Filobasidium floriforme]|uniref:acyltransferase ChoActase/COT/CPT n=1 Tax=Filobasidium floriforme TaxID=5210 RepID=UPI001E8CACEE|nr:acyltransferase ChoActase/COT/CPT [Filobasidium floriforme]KAH8089167.1 acyltransferase ChoActase/COT/CPT [Filobasidium floriforme]
MPVQDSNPQPATLSKVAHLEHPFQKGKTWAYQDDLPKLPVPKLEDTCRRYLRALEGLQDHDEHEKTKKIVEAFLQQEGPKWQEKLIAYDKTVDSYIEEFWYESYLQFQESVVLSLNPFFVLSTDVTPARNNQLTRASTLIYSSLCFIHDLHQGVLEPDTIRGKGLDMSQYTRLFATSRVPTERGCRIERHAGSQHIVVLRRGQFYWFDCLDADSRPCLSDKEILKNLESIVLDADKTSVHEVAQNAVGLLTTENRKIWNDLRNKIRSSNANNKECLSVVDSALFVVCLDDAEPQDLGRLCENFLCGTYEMSNGVQIGTCTNRWYDKLQIIVCANGEAGINFEHTGVDGHTVLRYCADIYTELVLLYAKSINPSTPSLFKAKLSPQSKFYKPKPDEKVETDEDLELVPKKLTWKLSPELKAGVRFAETRISDLICQNDSQALEFKGYGKTFITRHRFSPDAFVQMAFQAAYYGLYGRVESTYEPAMMKGFLHGRTESIRTVQPESVHFVKTFCSEGPTHDAKIKALRQACKRHTELTRECSQGQSQDRHLYALSCLIQREIEESKEKGDVKMPELFTDPGYSLLSTSVISTSNCGNPALRLFGFGPVTPEGHGIGYIIKDEGISVCASSKHLQTRRFLDTLQSYLYEIQRVLIQNWKDNNQASSSTYVDHTGTLRDTKTDKAIEERTHEGQDSAEDSMLSGFGFYDAGIDAVNTHRSRKHHAVGRTLPSSDY